jgi:hypothetical protein
VPSHGPCLLTFSRGGGGAAGVGGGQQQFGARARGGAVGRWGWCGPTCRRGGSAGRTAQGQNHEVERYPYAFFRGRDYLWQCFDYAMIHMCDLCPISSL